MTLVDERVSVVLAYIELIYVFKNVSLTEILVSIINDRKKYSFVRDDIWAG